MLPKLVSDIWKRWVGLEELAVDSWRAKNGLLQPSEQRQLRRRLMLWRCLVLMRSIVVFPIRVFTLPYALLSFGKELERLHFGPLRRMTRGVGCVIDRQTWLVNGQSIFLGDHVKLSAFSSIMAGAKATVRIGNYTIIGPGVLICAVNHGRSLTAMPIRWQRLEDFPQSSITIGENVWLGANVVILPGVEIGDGCIIGAGSVVSGKVPPGMIYVNKRASRFIARNASEASINVVPDQSCKKCTP